MEGRSITTGCFGGIDEGGPVGRVWRDTGRCVLCCECRSDHIDFLDTVDMGGLNDEVWEDVWAVLECSVREPDGVLCDSVR